MKPFITPQMALYNEGDRIHGNTLKLLRKFQANPYTAAKLRRMRKAIYLLARAGIMAADRREREAKERACAAG